MTWITFAFDRPEYLVLLLLLPVIWWTGRQSLRAMGGTRRWTAIGFRSIVLTLLVLALADVQLVRITDKIAAYFLLDQSLSLAPEQREESLSYVARAVAKHSDASKGDLAGVVVFGGEAQIEHPLDATAPIPATVETTLNPDHTNLAAALRLAKATFPEGVARRVVIVSDGNQNMGNALEEARGLASVGIGIDVAPLPYRGRADVRVEKVASPADVRIGVPFDVTIVLENVQPNRGSKPTAGRLTVIRSAADAPKIVADEQLTLPLGRKVLTLRDTLDEAGFYTYQARFTPDEPAQDRVSQNNQASSFTQLRGKGRVLWIVNSESQTEYDHLISRLRTNEIEVTVQTTNNLFTSLAQLQQYDSVVLANVPRTSGGGADSLAQFSDDQIAMLVRNVEQFGSGLIMLGGDNSFGAGGWANTDLEKALPVDFQIRNAKVAAVGALMLVIDRSGSMSGEKLELSKAAAQAAVQMLGPLDQIGVIAFDTGADDIVRLQRVGDQPHRIRGMIGRLGPGGGTNMEPAVRQGYAALQKTNASVKHMIILTDGQTEGSGYTQLAARMRQQSNITTTTVAVGTDAARSLLQDIAARGGGKYYQAMNPKVLPRIFTRETRRVVRPLVFENPQGFAPQIVADHDILRGIDSHVPPITGFVLTTLKENPLVEAPLLAPQPGAPNNTLLATWTYGLGRTAAFTTDGGQRWASDWTGWEGYDPLFVNLVRWSMRPPADDGNFTIATDIKDGKLRVAVTALDAKLDFLNNLPLAGELVGQGSAPAVGVPFKQVAPGRYIGEAPLTDPGSYLLAVQTGGRRAPLRTGVSVPYSAEFQDTEANEQLLLTLARLTPTGGEPGEIIRLPDDPQTWSRWIGPNIFRRDMARGRQLTSIWPLVLLIAAGIFLLDVMQRRITLTLPAPGAFFRWLRSRSSDASVPAPAIARLQARKTALADELYRERFSPELPVAESATLHDPSTPSPIQRLAADTADAEETSYSARLLRAKRELREQQRRRGS
jgi:uncharacterized membrane protein/uncharacterized protein YegL